MSLTPISRKVLTALFITATTTVAAFHLPLSTADSAPLLTNLVAQSQPTAQSLRILPGHPDPNLAMVYSVAISPDGQTLASCGYDKTIKLWNLKTGELLHTLTGNTSWVASVAFTPDGQTLVSGSADGIIKLWNPKTGELKSSFSEPATSIALLNVVASSQTLNVVLGQGGDTHLKWWNLQTKEALPRQPEFPGWIYSLALSADGKTLATGNDSGTMKVWNFPEGKLLRTFPWASSVGATTLALTSDGKTLAIGKQEKIELWNVTTGKQIRTLSMPVGVTTVRAMSFSPDGQTLAIGTWQKKIELWNINTGKRLRSVELKGGWSNLVMFTRDGSTVIGGNGDGTIAIWRVSP